MIRGVVVEGNAKIGKKEPEETVECDWNDLFGLEDIRHEYEGSDDDDDQEETPRSQDKSEANKVIFHHLLL